MSDGIELFEAEECRLVDVALATAVMRSHELADKYSGTEACEVLRDDAYKFDRVLSKWRRGKLSVSKDSEETR